MAGRPGRKLRILRLEKEIESLREKSLGFEKWKGTLKSFAQHLVHKYRLIQFAANVAAGNVPDHVMRGGQVVRVPASLDTRKGFLEILLDRGWGKPSQEQSVVWDPKSSPIVLLPARDVGSNGSDSVPKIEQNNKT